MKLAFNRVNGGYALEGAATVARPGAPTPVPGVSGGSFTLRADTTLPARFELQFIDREDAAQRFAKSLSVSKAGGEALDVSYRADDSLTAARVLLKLVEKEQPGIVLLGKQAIDDDCNQTGQMLAALWERPQATFASKVDVDGNVARVTREVDAGLETIEVDLPAVVTTDLRLNEPRFIKLPDIMKAKSKPIETLQLAELGVASGDTLKTTRYAPPAKRSKGVMVKDVGELVAALKSKGLL